MRVTDEAWTVEGWGPASEKQIARVKALAAERPDYYSDIHEDAVAEVVREVGHLPRRTAAVLIRDLLAQPREVMGIRGDR